MFVTRQVGEEWLDECLLPKFKKENSIMVWGGILGETGTKFLVLWEKNDWGTITAQTYIDHILQASLWPFWFWESHRCGPDLHGRPLWIMEDGAPAHRAGATKAWQDERHMPKLVWPPSSPDLNPIENIWHLLKTRLNKRNPHPTTMAAVRVAILEEWNGITIDEIRRVVDNMPQRVQAVLAAEGGHTKW